MGHLIPEQPETLVVEGVDGPPEPTSTNAESPTTATTVSDTEDATPEPESGTEGPAADTMNEKPKRARTSRRKRGKA